MWRQGKGEEDYRLHKGVSLNTFNQKDKFVWKILKQHFFLKKVSVAQNSHLSFQISAVYMNDGQSILRS